MQNQHLWCQNGVIMSLGNQGVFTASERGDFSKNSGILQLAEIRLNCSLSDKRLTRPNVHRESLIDNILMPAGLLSNTVYMFDSAQDD